MRKDPDFTSPPAEQIEIALMPSLLIPTDGTNSVDHWEGALMEAFSPAVAELVIAAPVPGLQEGPRDDGLANWLGSHSAAETVVADLRESVDTDAVTSGLWLLAGELDRSHDLSQQLKTPQGSFLHGVMHRREGDYGNAKYWFHRAQCTEIELAVASVHPDDYANADGFVDQIQSVCRGGTGDAEAMVSTQWAEWIVLMASLVS